MGVLYSCIPITDTPEILAWLQEQRVTLPSPSIFGRDPTPQEIRTALDSIENYTADYAVSRTFWQANVSYTAEPEQGPWTCINVLNYQDDESQPYHIYFEKGWPELILTIMERLSRLCGPLMCVPDTGATPIVVTPGLKSSEAVLPWYNISAHNEA
jgi:hypothetical protein